MRMQGDRKLRGCPAGAGVVQVAAGAQHSMALTKGGEVLSWGNGRYGALGLGPGEFLS